LLGFHSQALKLQGKFEFHKGLKVIRCYVGSPGKSGEAHPHLVASLAQIFVINSSCIPACIPFKSISVCRRSLVSTMETIASVIKYILTIIPASCIWQLHDSQYRLQKWSHSKFNSSFKNLHQGWEPIYYHWSHELCIIAGGPQNQFILS